MKEEIYTRRHISVNLVEEYGLIKNEIDQVAKRVFEGG